MTDRNAIAAAALRACTVLGVVCTAGCSGASAPEPVDEPAPMPGASPFTYPVDLWDRGVEGESTLMVHVTERGAVDSAYVLTSSGFAEFDSAAVHGAHALQFTPARRGREGIAMWTRLPVRFNRDTLATADGEDAAGAAVPASLRETSDSAGSLHE